MSRTVLICDDALFMRTMVGDILTQAGFEVVGEIAEGVEVSRMPAMLESVRASVARTTEVLEMLARHLGTMKPDRWDDA